MPMLPSWMAALGVAAKAVDVAVGVAAGVSDAGVGGIDVDVGGAGAGTGWQAAIRISKLIRMQVVLII